MSIIGTNCPFCGSYDYEIGAFALGMNAKCRECGAMFIVSTGGNIPGESETCTAEEIPKSLRRFIGRPLDIAVDFDGTCVTNAYPKVGHDIGAGEILRTLVAKGHRLILCTMRSGKKLEDAIRWFASNGISLYSVNDNPGQKQWTRSRKIHADIYIDNQALGCPLYEVSGHDGRIYRFVNWKRVARWLFVEGVFDIDDYTMCVSATCGTYNEMKRLLNENEDESKS